MSAPRIPPPGPMPDSLPHPDIPVVELERIAALGWPGTEQEHLGDWLLRAGGGFTGRANSALPLGDPGVDRAAAVVAVQRFYAARGLAARIQVPIGPAAPQWAGLDHHLATWRWAGGDEAVVMVAPLTALRRPAPPVRAQQRRVAVALAADPSPEWLRGYRYRGGDLPATAVAVLRAGGGPVFATARQSGGRVGVARGIVTHGWLGVTAVTVEPAARRRGVATGLMRALGDWAGDAGARAVYVQVAADNAPAVALYRRLGFAPHHRYHYRTAPGR